MELRLIGLGTVEIIDATRVAGDDILIRSSDNFSKIAKATDYEITEVYLVEVDFKWSLVACLNVPDDNWYDDDTIVYQIKNQDDVYRLNALL